MNDITSFEFLVGIAIGKILFGAMFASPFFRNVALALAAICICFLYATDGVAGILRLAHLLQADVIARPNFSKGFAVGVTAAFVVFGMYRSRTKA